MDKKELKKILEVIGEIIIDKMRINLSEEGLKNSRLSKNIGYKVVNYNLIITLPDYAEYVETGRRPGKHVPINELIAWIKRKKIRSNISINSLAFAISNSIKKNGIEARPFIKETFNETVEEVTQTLTVDLKTIIEDTLKNILTL